MRINGPLEWRNVARSLSFLGAASVGAQTLPPAQPMKASSHICLWQTKVMTEEPICFVKKGAELPSGNLLFPARKILKVTDTSGKIIYREGKDFILSPNRDKVTLTSNSRIRFLEQKDLYPAAAMHFSGFTREGHRWMLYTEGTLFPDHQPRFTYEYAGWTGPLPVGAASLLPRTWAKLKKGEPLSLVLYGDSIATGANATEVINIPPHLPPYGPRVAQILKNQFGGPVNFKNVSQGGMTAGWALENVKRVLDCRPELVILAWGMNDASEQVPSAKYAERIEGIIQAVQKVNPKAEFVLVATMQSNPEWNYSRPKLYDGYLKELNKLSKPGVAVADVTTMWKYLCRRKSFLDLTGNGLNHPNDFGQILYADVVAAAILNNRPKE